MFIVRLLILILTGSFVSCYSSYCQEEDISPLSPKGMYIISSPMEQFAYYDTIIYHADPQVMSETWSSNTFVKLKNQYTTGVYGANGYFKSTSPIIKLPKKQSDSKLYLKLDHGFHTETFYDNLFIRVQNIESGEEYSLYNASGISNGSRIEYVDLTYHAGTSISLELLLLADSSDHGEGWFINDVAIVGSHLGSGSNDEFESSIYSMETLRKSSGLPQDTTAKVQLHSKSEVANVNVMGVEWEDASHGVISFTLSDNQRKDMKVNDLNANDLTLKIISPMLDTISIGSCKELIEIERGNVDFIFAIDCSQSMQSMQASLKNCVTPLIDTLKNLYNVQFAEVKFGNIACREGCFNELKNSKYYKFGRMEAVNGGEYYFYILGKIAEYPFNFSAMSQKVILMIGDEDSTQGNNSNLTRQEAIAKLSINNFQTFIVNQEDRGIFGCRSVSNMDYCRSSFEKICQETNGKYIVASNPDDSCATNGLVFQTNDITKAIGESLNNRYYLSFCLDTFSSVGYCGDTIKVSLSLSVGDSTLGATDSSRIKYLPIIERDDESAALDTIPSVCKDTVPIVFTISNYCESDTIREAYVSYRYKEDQTLINVKAQYLGKGEWVSKIPFINIPDGTAVEYKISAMNSWATITLPSTEDTTKQMFSVQKQCEFLDCSSVRISANPIRVDSCLLSFNLSRDTEITIAIFRADGTPLYDANGQMITIEHGAAGNNEWKMSELFPGIFEMEINPQEPLILAVKSPQETSMVYFYVSRVRMNE